ncbi:MAG: T9SS type A sorting domain-containing protein, partial [Prolixibacteraceae bacterium]|nr:T9SS type A sorting domain-containing protein [Prolixibacteraceae bacterium]
YPNPTTGAVNLSGVESGNRIRVFNAMGATIRDMVAGSTKVTFSIADQPAGMYMILVNDGDARFKVIRK